MSGVLTQTAVGLIIHQSQVLLLQRPKKNKTYGLWCFPGGTVEDHESPERALDRELDEEVGIQVLEKTPLLYVSRNKNDQVQNLFVYYIKNYQRALSNPENHRWTWAQQHELEDYPSFKINLLITEYLQHHPQKDSHTKHAHSYMQETITNDGAP